MNKTIRHFLFIVGLLFAFTGQFSQAKEADVVRDLPTLGSYGSLSLVTGENKSLTPSAAPTNSAFITAYTSGANATNFSGTLTVDPTTGVVSVTNPKPVGTSNCYHKILISILIKISYGNKPRSNASREICFWSKSTHAISQ